MPKSSDNQLLLSNVCRRIRATTTVTERELLTFVTAILIFVVAFKDNSGWEQAIKSLALSNMDAALRMAFTIVLREEDTAGRGMKADVSEELLLISALPPGSEERSLRSAYEEALAIHYLFSRIAVPRAPS
ncbi:hypothetical protein DFS34DRAFT_650505 [Phlyctochytrium arcticum]|nr:hypothetical protein DFS34DRAFT_652508 [Phlyctochytrium arcticum]KAI9097128.1 hypothetical protein DFS34DRAFT_650505 [Phlyctochytrium arcticum]